MLGDRLFGLLAKVGFLTVKHIDGSEFAPLHLIPKLFAVRIISKNVSLLFFSNTEAVDDGRNDRFGKGSGHTLDRGVFLVKE